MINYVSSSTAWNLVRLPAKARSCKQADIPRRFHAFALAPTRGRLGGCGRQEVSQVPTRSFRARAGLRPRQGGGASHNGPAHVAFGALDRLGPCVAAHFVAQYRPHTIAVYASPWSSPSTPQHSLQAGATPYLGRTLTGWTTPASPGAPKVELSRCCITGSLRPPCATGPRLVF